MKLSVLMPVYNEREWLEKVVQRVMGQEVQGIHELEIVIVDDGSKDGTREIIKNLAMKYPKVIFPTFHEKNMGKGGAIRTSIEKGTGDI